MTSDPFIGQTAGGVYLIERHVADGGIGRVYCGRHLRLGHQVAVKVLSAEHNASLEARHRFEREARIAAELAHPHIVKVYDFDVLPDGNYFLTMEWLEGETLECLLRRGLNSAAIIDILSQLAGAIDFAHAKGAIHRDLKPANVFVISDGLQGKYYAKILDFGIAKMHQHTTGITTQADVIMGTPAYMAPEQAEGTRAIGPAADRYAFAAIAMEMIAGILPHSLNTPSRMLVSLLTGDAQLPSASGTCYQHLDDVFRKAFARHPAARFPSCVAFVEQLIPLLVRHDETPFAPTLQQRRLSVVPSWRRWFLLLIVAAVLG
ncbi:MAG: serine/threonine protein kinase, partial [Myxococcales bacterium]|nr:serine/threonine protein kinase [Myxococcales bacterium]